MSNPNIKVNVSGPVQAPSTYKTKILKGNQSFASQVTEPNTKYVIKHTFDLSDGAIVYDGWDIEGMGGNPSIIDGEEYWLTDYESGIAEPTTYNLVDDECFFVIDNHISDTKEVTLQHEENAWIATKRRGYHERILSHLDPNAAITIPENCVLEFDGGSLNNGNLSGVFSIITDYKCFYNVTFSENYSVFPIIAFVKNCKAFDTTVDCHNDIVYALTCGVKVLRFNGDEKFYIGSTIDVTTSCDIIGDKPKIEVGNSVLAVDTFCGIWTDKDISLLKITYNNETSYNARTLKGFALANESSSFATETQENVALLEITTAQSTAVWGLDIDVDINAKRSRESIDNNHNGYLIEKYHYTGVRIYPAAISGCLITQMYIDGNIKGCYKAYDIGKRSGDISSSWTTWTYILGNTWVAKLGYSTAGPTIIHGFHQAASCFLVDDSYVAFAEIDAPFHVYGNLMDIGVTRYVYHEGHQGDPDYRITVSTAAIGIENLNKETGESHPSVSSVNSPMKVLNKGFGFTESPLLNTFKLFGSNGSILSKKYIKEGIVEISNKIVANGTDPTAEGYLSHPLELVCPDCDKIFQTKNLLREANPVASYEIYNTDRSVLKSRILYVLDNVLWTQIYLSFDVVIHTKKIGGLDKLNRFVLQNLGWALKVDYVALDENKDEIADSKIENIAYTNDPFARIFSYGGVSTIDSNTPLCLHKYPNNAEYVKFTFVYNRSFSSTPFLLCPALGLIGNISSNFTQDGGELYGDIIENSGIVFKKEDNNKYTGKEQKTISVSSSFYDYSTFLKCYYKYGVAQTVYVFVHDEKGEQSVIKIAIGTSSIQDVNKSLSGTIRNARFRIQTYSSKLKDYVGGEFFTLIVENSGTTIIVDDVISTGELVFSDYDYQNTYLVSNGVLNSLPVNGNFADATFDPPYVGYPYFCLDKQTEEGASNGIMLFFKGKDLYDPENPKNIWVDALGRVVS